MRSAARARRPGRAGPPPPASPGPARRRRTPRARRSWRRIVVDPRATLRAEPTGIRGNGCMRVVVCLAVAILLRVDARMFAQSRATGGDLIGVVADPSGAVVPGAHIAAVDTQTNLRRTVLSDAAGNFAIL